MPDERYMCHQYGASGYVDPFVDMSQLARIQRLEATVGTLIMWLHGGSLSREEATQLATMLNSDGK